VFYGGRPDLYCSRWLLICQGLKCGAPGIELLPNTATLMNSTSPAGDVWGSVPNSVTCPLGQQRCDLLNGFARLLMLVVGLTLEYAHEIYVVFKQVRLNGKVHVTKPM